MGIYVFCSPDMEVCLSNPCVNMGTCIDGVTSVTCSCLEGFTGHNCETGIQHIEWLGYYKYLFYGNVFIFKFDWSLIVLWQLTIHFTITAFLTQFMSQLCCQWFDILKSDRVDNIMLCCKKCCSLRYAFHLVNHILTILHNCILFRVNSGTCVLVVTNYSGNLWEIGHMPQLICPCLWWNLDL